VTRKLPVRGTEGTVQTAIAVIRKKNTVTTMKDARQLEYLVATPDEMLPTTNPSGLPQPKAPITIFLRRPGRYVVKRIPTAGGEIAAVPRPKNPRRISSAIPCGAKAVMRAKMLRKTKPKISWALRPKRSAVFPKNSTNEPLERLKACQCRVGQEERAHTQVMLISM
jgi:hypothetical protein